MDARSGANPHRGAIHHTLSTINENIKQDKNIMIKLEHISKWIKSGTSGISF